MHLYQDGIRVDADEVVLPPTTSTGNHTSLHLPHYIMGIAFLHNFVVNYHLRNGDTDLDIFQDLQDDTTTTEGRMPPSQQEDRNGNPLLYDDNGQTYRLRIGRGVLLLCHRMALRIHELALQ